MSKTLDLDKKINTKNKEEFQRWVIQDQKLQNYQILGLKSKKHEGWYTLLKYQ